MSSQATDKSRHEPCVELVAQALCRHAHPARTIDEALSPNVVLWQRFVPEAQIAVDAMRKFVKPSSVTPIADPGGDLEILRMALGNTAACLGDALATFNRVVGQEVFKNAAPQESGESRSTLERAQSGQVAGVDSATEGKRGDSSVSRPDTAGAAAPVEPSATTPRAKP